MQHWRSYNPQPQCSKCSKFIPYSRATLVSVLKPPPSVGVVEWFVGLCVKCEANQKDPDE